MRRTITTLLAVAILATACGGNRDSTGGTGGSAVRDAETAPDNARLVSGATGSARVSYQPAVKAMERRAFLDAVAGVSTEGSTLFFVRPDATLSALREGDVLLVKGLLRTYGARRRVCG
jgi:hypothetical protein